MSGLNLYDDLPMYGVATNNYSKSMASNYGAANTPVGNTGITNKSMAPGAGMGAAGMGRGGNWLDGAGRVMDIVGNLGRIYAAIQGVRLGKQQLNFARQAFNTNTANQTQTYNTSLEDRIRARYNTEGRSGEADGYLEQNRLQHRPL
jgi:hypothetical protein